MVRGFARYLQAHRPATQVPPPGPAAARAAGAPRRTCTPTATSPALIGPRAGRCARRCAAATYADADRAAGRHRAADRRGAAAWTATTSTWPTGVLIVRAVEVRQVPQRARCTPPPSARCGLRRPPRPALPATRAPARVLPRQPAPRLDAHNVSHTFADMLAHGRDRPPRPATRRPRIHDLRHSFAVATLLDWYRDGGDVAGPAAAAVDLPRPRRPRPHLLVPAGRPRAARAWPPSGSTTAPTAETGA